MADTHGFPELGSNPVYGEIFDGTVASNQGILVQDNTGIASPLVIPQANQFSMAVKLTCDGILAGFLHTAGQAFTIDYYAENLTNGQAKKIASVPLNFNAGTLGGGQVTFDVGLTQTPLLSAAAVAGLVGAGSMRLTAQHSFGGVYPFSAYVTGPVIEIV